FLLLGFCNGVSGGFTLPIAQKFGAKDFSLMRTYVWNAAFLCVIFSVVFTVGTAILCRPILVLMKTPESILNDSVSYLRTIFFGIPFLFLYNFIANLMRSLGDSRTPLYFLVASSFLNILLDLFFIRVCSMGVAGAALATVISQALPGFVILVFLVKKFSILKMSREEKVVAKKHCYELCRFGIPMGLQYSITAIGSVILQSSVNELGPYTVTAIAAGMKINMLFASVFDSFGLTMATYGGQNTGAAKYERLVHGVRDCMLISAAYSIVAFVTVFFFGKNFVYIFLKNPTEKILSEAYIFLLANFGFYITLAAVNVYRFMIQGMGFSAFSMFSGVAEMLARTAMGIFAVPVFGIYGAVFASPAAWVLADCFLVPAFYHCVRKLKNAHRI
ncbi:MAG: polysaccharide biosynthesis C-terminal domain-containing protein, partial [Treponemataceae bacterium]|nr:polysaccharide biosynthesis C-terminal domain-containing protein [Treponemataceae bacterium]